MEIYDYGSDKSHMKLFNTSLEKDVYTNVIHISFI